MNREWDLPYPDIQGRMDIVQQQELPKRLWRRQSPPLLDLAWSSEWSSKRRSKRPAQSPASNVAVYKWAMKRTRGNCWYCGIVLTPSVASRDHVVPKSLGGSGKESNLVPACRPCNNGKDSISLNEWRSIGPTEHGLFWGERQGFVLVEVEGENYRRWITDDWNPGVADE